MNNFTKRAFLFFSFAASLGCLLAQPTVNTPTISAITTTSATLGGKITVGTSVTAHGTAYKTTASVIQSDNPQDNGAVPNVAIPFTFTQNRSGLTAGTQYFWRAFATGTGGTGLFAADEVFFTEPNQSGTFTSAAASNSQIDLTFPAASTLVGAAPAKGGYVIFRKAGSAPTVSLTDGTAPPADGVGDKIATVTNDALTTYSDMGLTAQTSYTYTIVPFVWDNATATLYNYNTTSPLSTTRFTLSNPPSGQPGSFTATTISNSQINLAWASVTANGFLVYRRLGSTAPDVSTGFVNGSNPPDPLAADGSTLVNTAAGGVTSFSNTTGLSAATQYSYTIVPFGYNGSATQTYNYLTVSAKTSNAFTLSNPPASAPPLFDVVATSTTQITLTFTDPALIGNTFGYILLRRQDGSDPDATGVNNGSTVSAMPTAGTTKVATILAGTTTYPDNGLTTGTQYNYSLIPFNWDNTNTETYNYLTSPIVSGFDTPSTGVSITAPTLSTCPGNYVTLGNIKITEGANAHFSNSGTLFLEFDNPAFSFQPGQGSISVNPASASNNDIDAITLIVNASRLTINYTLDGNNNKRDEIIISNLKVTYDGSPPTTALIIRTGGTANITGDNATGASSVTHGTLSSLPVSAIPVVSVTTLNYCQNDVISPTPNVTSNNSNVVWYTDAALTTSIPSLNGITNVNSLALLSQLGFVTTSAATITRYVTQTPVGQCQSPARTITLNVQAKPVADLVITSGSSTLCVGRNIVENVNPGTGAITYPTFAATLVYDNVTFTASPTGATNYNFRKNGMTVQTSSSNTLVTSSQFLNTGDNIDVIVTVSGSCPSTSNVIPMTINKNLINTNFKITFPPPPASTPDSLNTFSSQLDTVRLKPVPAGGVFSGLGITNRSGINYFGPSLVGQSTGGPYYLSYTTTSSGCESKRTRAFYVFDGSTAITGLNTIYCSNDANFTLASNSRAGYTLMYILPQNFYSSFSPLLPTGSITNAGGDINQPNQASWWNGTFTITNAPFTIRPSTITSNGVNTVTITFYAYYVNNATSIAETRTQIVTFVPAPVQPTASVTGNFCTADATLTSNTISVGTSNSAAVIRWFRTSAPAGEITALANKALPTFGELGVAAGTAATYTYNVTQTVGGCESAPRPLTITVNATPSAPVLAAPSPGTFCSGFPIGNFTVTNPTLPSGAQIRWYNTAGLVGEYSPIVSTGGYAATSTELAIPSSVSSITLVTRFATQTLNNCQSPPASVNITINPVPSTIPSTAPTVCKNATIPNFSASPSSGATVKWYRDALLTNEVIPISNPASPTASEMGVSSESAPILTSFYITQSIGGCVSSTNRVDFKVNDLPSVSFTSVPPLCKTGSPINLIANEVNGDLSGGTWGQSAAPALGSVNLPPGTAILDPSNANLVAGQAYKLRYTVTDNSTCTNFTEQDIVVLPSVNPSIKIVNACEGSNFTIENTSTILSASTTTSSIVSYGWSFVGRDNVPPNRLPVLATDDISSATVSGTYIKPVYSYPAAGSYQVQYTMITSDQCMVTPPAQLINVGVNPAFTFGWSNPCQAEGIQFNANPSGGAGTLTYSWNFAKNGTLTPTSGSNTIQNPLVSYSNLGTDVAELTITGTSNQQGGIGGPGVNVCSQIKQKSIFVVPNNTSSSLAPYTEGFEASNGNWLTGGASSSWLWEAPGRTKINSNGPSTAGTKIWETNNAGTYNTSEKSFLLSPCFDFSGTNFKKPVLSFDLITSTPDAVDGVTVQYALSDDIETQSNWVTLGAVNQGKNWYSTPVISSNPGNQPSGWSGNSNPTASKPQWMRSTYTLDMLIGSSSKVKFRLAFASSSAGASAGSEGVAIDNFFIGDRSRIVLVENFTNTSTKADPQGKTQNAFYNSLPTTVGPEIVRLQYHTGFPGLDPINTAFSSIHNPRAAFYGIDIAPSARVDGGFESGAFPAWASSYYGNRVLEPANVKITPSLVKQPNGEVKISTSITATSTLSKGTYVFIVLAEKQMNDPKFKGQNGEQIFNYVAKDMFPSPSGYRLPNDVVVTNNTPVTFSIPDVTWAGQDKLLTAGNGAIIIFLQNDSQGKKDVLQSILIDNPVHPDLVTGLEPTLEQFAFYPIPADKTLEVKIAEKAKNYVPLVVYDAIGKVVAEAGIDEGQQTKTLNTAEWAGGVYIIQLETDKGKVRKKVMVAH
jgi:Secretion system C-terminal sorting domain